LRLCSRPLPSPHGIRATLNSGIVERVYRLGFETLEKLYQQAMGDDNPLFSASTRNAISNGDIHIVSAQWAAYLPTKDKELLTQTLVLLLRQNIARRKGVFALAKYLGLVFTDYVNFDTEEVPGIMMRKLYGKKHVFSVSLYDKLVRLGQMRQVATLLAKERDLVTNNIRLDITAHSEGIKVIIAAARAKLLSLLEHDAETFGVVSPELFLSEDAQSKVWWLERAIFVLSHRPDKSGVRRWSFATWIVPYMLKDVLRLDALTSFTTDSFKQFLKLTDKVAVAWRGIETPNSENWADELAGMAGCSISTVHSRRKEWLIKYKIDISLPFAFYRDLLFFGGNSFTKAADRAATNQAMWEGDGEKLVEMRTQAVREFDRKRIDVGAMAQSGPMSIPLKGSIALKGSRPKSIALKGSQDALPGSSENLLPGPYDDLPPLAQETEILASEAGAPTKTGRTAPPKKGSKAGEQSGSAKSRRKNRDDREGLMRVKALIGAAMTAFCNDDAGRIDGPNRTGSSAI
jgi:hypothetical protein